MIIEINIGLWSTSDWGGRISLRTMMIKEAFDIDPVVSFFWVSCFGYWHFKLVKIRMERIFIHEVHGILVLFYNCTFRYDIIPSWSQKNISNQLLHKSSILLDVSDRHYIAHRLISTKMMIKDARFFNYIFRDSMNLCTWDVH